MDAAANPRAPGHDAHPPRGTSRSSSESITAQRRQETDEIKGALGAPLRQAFLFLCGMNSAELRSVASHYGVPQGFPRNLQISRNFLFVYNQVQAENCTVQEILLVDEDWGFAEFRADWNLLHKSRAVPSLEHIQKTAASKTRDEAPPEHPSVLDKRKNKKRRKRKASYTLGTPIKPLPTASGATGEDPASSAVEGLVPASKKRKSVTKPKASPFTASEFARLLLFLKEDEDMREAFLKSGKSLGRQQIDRGERSTDFWNQLVVPSFNDPSDGPTLNFESVLEDIDVSKGPPVERSGPYLKRVYDNFRFHMQKPYSDYQKSGQNNPDWKAFVIDGGTDPDSSVGKQLILAGFILNIGLPQEDKDFLSVLTRTIAPGGGKSGRGGYEGGMGEFDSAEQGTRRPSSRRTSFDSKAMAQSQVGMAQSAKKFFDLASQKIFRGQNEDGQVQERDNDGGSKSQASLGTLQHNAETSGTGERLFERQRILRALTEAVQESEKAPTDEIKGLWTDQAQDLKIALAASPIKK